MIDFGFSLSAPRKSISEVNNEINQLSDKDKEKLNRDLYGSDDCSNNNFILLSEDIHNGILRMEAALVNICTRDGNDNSNLIQYYLRANEVVPDFANCTSLRVQFLFCEEFDANKAAIRFVKYWKERVLLWGEEIAYRRICITDFTVDDQYALKLGAYQVGPVLDKYKRGIMYCNQSIIDHRPEQRIHQLRQFWYTYEAILERPEVIQNGFIHCVGLEVRPKPMIKCGRHFGRCAIQLANVLPIRCVAIHHAVTSRMMEYVVPFLLFLLDCKERRRYRCYPKNERIYDILQKCGIDRSEIPCEFGGYNEAFNYGAWLESRRLNDL
jgi:hypothetical protein